MGTTAIRDAQQALKDQGFDPGEIDGVWGRNTIAAVKKFQQQHGLEVDGVIGPLTTAALLGSPPGVPVAAAAAPVSSSPLVWFEEAKHLVGVKEVPGSQDNPIIMDWAADLHIIYEGDDVPWCGLFAAHCVGSTLSDERLPGNPLGARQWEKFGDPTAPRLGAIMVFWREPKDQGVGHVGFYNGEDATAHQILGGNQADQVSLAWLPKNRFLQARWPHTAAGITSKTVMKARGDNRLSENEA